MLELVKKYYIYAIIIIIFCVIILLIPVKKEELQIDFNPQVSSEKIDEPRYIYIDIKGEVQNPGVYKVLKEYRLFQLLSLAGGVTGEADTLAINLSLKLYDQQVLYIPSYEDGYPIIIDVIDKFFTNIVNINSASIELLDTLPGIGPSTAKSIVDYRNEVGFFDSIEDIMKVTGIGEATFDEIKDFITV